VVSHRTRIASIASVAVVAVIVAAGFLVAVPVTSLVSIPFTVTATIGTSYNYVTVPYTTSTQTVMTSTSESATYVFTTEQTFLTASIITHGILTIHVALSTSTSTKTCSFAFWSWLLVRQLACP
jgi:hypothetical protein